MRIMPEAKRFLSQFGLRSFVEFVFVQRGFLQILPVDLIQKKKNKKKEKRNFTIQRNWNYRDEEK